MVVADELQRRSAPSRVPEVASESLRYGMLNHTNERSLFILYLNNYM